MTGPLRQLILLLLLGLTLARPALAEPPALELGVLEQLAEAGGLGLERQRWSLGGNHGWIWRARAPRLARLQVRAADEPRPFAAFLPREPGPWVAINGGFFDLDRTPMGLVIADGIEVAPLRRAGGSGILEVRDGKPRILHHSEFSPGANQALQSIDRIVAGGRSLVRQRPGARLAARAAVAMSAELIWFVLAASDELWPTTAAETTLHAAAARGLPLWALADYLVSVLGAQDGLNLDGSVSAQMAARIGDYELGIKGIGMTVNALVMRP